MKLKRNKKIRQILTIYQRKEQDKVNFKENV